MRIATVFTVALLFISCNSKSAQELMGITNDLVPQGIAKDFTLYYNEYVKSSTAFSEIADHSDLIAILKSPISEDFEQLNFPYRVFPEGLELTLYEEGKPTTIIESNYGKLYSSTYIVNLEGAVKVRLYDGSTLETEQLYWDRLNDWIFTEADFVYTNVEDQTIMHGKGLDFKRNFNYFNAHKTYGTMVLKEE